MLDKYRIKNTTREVSVWYIKDGVAYVTEEETGKSYNISADKIQEFYK
jgi:hypothetical protein